MSNDDVSRETSAHAETEQHQQIEATKPQRRYDHATRTIMDIVIEYRADGCITWREAEKS